LGAVGSAEGVELGGFDSNVDMELGGFDGDLDMGLDEFDGDLDMELGEQYGRKRMELVLMRPHLASRMLAEFVWGELPMQTKALMLQIACAAVSLSSCAAQDDGGTGGVSAPQRNEAPSLTTNWPLSDEAARGLQKSEADRLGVPCFSRLDLGDSVFIDLVFVPGGTFPMGNASDYSNPGHLVRISNGFLVAEYEVTWRQFLRVVDLAETDGITRDSVSRLKERRTDWLDIPADVDWLLADKFCRRLTDSTGVTVRLITEAEWEYAARAGTMKPYGQWDSIDDKKANIGMWPGPNGQTVYGIRLGLVPGGQYEPNRWGIHDMMGNAQEWCKDNYTNKLAISALGAVDPVTVKRWSPFRVLRGGKWHGAETVFHRDGDAESSLGRGIRLVVEINDAVRAKLVSCTGPGES